MAFAHRTPEQEARDNIDTSLEQARLEGAIKKRRSTSAPALGSSFVSTRRMLVQPTTFFSLTRNQSA